MSNNNIFASLARYNSATNENYLTESLVFLVRLLNERDPEVGLAFTNFLCGAGKLLFNQSDTFSVSTQYSTEAGFPDIAFISENALVFIEVKHDSPLGYQQLERYKTVLDKTGRANAHLRLLTRSRYSAIGTTLSPDQYSRLYWHEIHKWLSQHVLDDPVCEYFKSSFMEFLEEKQMSLKQISPEYAPGIQALIDLTNMIQVAANDCLPGIKLIKTGGWHWRGFYLPGNYWIGVRFHEPQLLLFENNRGYEPVTLRHPLALDKIGFFAMTADEQLNSLSEFILKAIDGLELTGPVDVGLDNEMEA